MKHYVPQAWDMTKAGIELNPGWLVVHPRWRKKSFLGVRCSLAMPFAASWPRLGQRGDDRRSPGV